MKLELHQFPSSHFNEKARWALDYKGLEHSRLNYLPGPHMRPIKKLSLNYSLQPLN
jgi:glutathione S-transferase